MLLALVTPVNAPWGDSPVTGLNLDSVVLNPDALTAVAYMSQVGGSGGPGTGKQVTVAITGSTTMLQLLAAIKAAAAAKYSVVFQ